MTSSGLAGIEAPQCQELKLERKRRPQRVQKPSEVEELGVHFKAGVKGQNNKGDKLARASCNDEIKLQLRSQK